MGNLTGGGAHEQVVLQADYFSATKLAWLLAHLPGARRRAERGELCFGTVNSYLLFRLTGRAVHATDVSNAAPLLRRLPIREASMRIRCGVFEEGRGESARTGERRYYETLRVTSTSACPARLYS